MEHVMFVEKLKKENRNDYIRIHKEACKEFLKVINNAGIKREIAWLYGDYVFVYVMSEDFKKSRSILEKEDVFKKWIEMTKPFIEDDVINPNNERVTIIEKIFDVEEQLKE
ncbi:MAG: L-rhamnose mutarotase [Actinobacteria bacterium]|nr:L-rhamnose mutarotase [Actinomycetota bacterium]